MTIYPGEQEFLRLTKKGNLIPVYAEVSGDLETPVSAYFKVAANTKYSFLLESVEGEEKVARYSFLAKDPELVLRSEGNSVFIHRFDEKLGAAEKATITTTPLEFIRDIMRGYTLVDIPSLPRFCGGLVGYMGYDVVRFFEKLPQCPKDDLKLPDILMVLAKNLVIFDHRNHKIQIVSCVSINTRDSKQTQRKKYAQALKTIESLVSELHRPLKSHEKKVAFTPQVKSNITRSQFEKNVRQAKKHIKAGDIIQVVLSQRFSVPIKTNPFNIYRSLRAINPSPYMYYLNFDGLQIVGSSPELLVRCEDGVVETRPIAGTRRRGQNEKEDARLAQELLRDPKEKAEHIMLVDLGRNDLGRVCEQGSVRISEFMAIEKYSHVMHIVSNVKGTLSKDKDALDVLEAAFPAGTVSGAPKIRAMEIIDDLENVKRGPYAGAVGYLSFSKNLDTCITIRTIVVTKKRAYIQAGAGIVADSVPIKEYTETINKAKAQIMAIELAHNQGQ